MRIEYINFYHLVLYRLIILVCRWQSDPSSQYVNCRLTRDFQVTI